jgi:hypothetical protein
MKGSLCEKGNSMIGKYEIPAIEFEACDGYPVNLPIRSKNNRIRALGRGKQDPLSVLVVEIWK